MSRSELFFFQGLERSLSNKNLGNQNSLPPPPHPPSLSNPIFLATQTTNQSNNLTEEATKIKAAAAEKAAKQRALAERAEAERRALDEAARKADAEAEVSCIFYALSLSLFIFPPSSLAALASAFIYLFKKSTNELREPPFRGLDYFFCFGVFAPAEFLREGQTAVFFFLRQRDFLFQCRCRIPLPFQ